MTLDEMRSLMEDDLKLGLEENVLSKDPMKAKERLGETFDRAKAFGTDGVVVGDERHS